MDLAMSERREIENPKTRRLTQLIIHSLDLLGNLVELLNDVVMATLCASGNRERGSSCTRGGTSAGTRRDSTRCTS